MNHSLGQNHSVICRVVFFILEVLSQRNVRRFGNCPGEAGKASASVSLPNPQYLQRDCDLGKRETS